MMAQLEVVLSDTLPLPDTSTSSQPHLLWVQNWGLLSVWSPAALASA